MRIESTSVKDYLDKIPENQKPYVLKIREAILNNIDPEFEEGIGYGMMGYSVPKSIYPAGYHCDPKTPLPFAGLAAQKNFIALYHMGIYSDPKLLEWFQSEYPKHAKTKLDMGKSCIRFKKYEDIPYDLIGQLFSKMNVSQWIQLYESQLKK